DGERQQRRTNVATAEPSAGGKQGSKSPRLSEQRPSEPGGDQIIQQDRRRGARQRRTGSRRRRRSSRAGCWKQTGQLIRAGSRSGSRKNWKRTGAHGST